MVIHRLKTRHDRAAEDELARLRCQVLEAEGLSLDARQRVTHILDREQASRSGWGFVMVNVELFHEVLMHCLHRTRRPKQAAALWSKLFSLLPPDSNGVQATRAELARLLGMPACVVSEVMGELEELGAVYRRRDGRGVRYFVHPLMGTHLKGAVRDRAQTEAPPLRLIEGGAAMAPRSPAERRPGGWS